MEAVLNTTSTTVYKSAKEILQAAPDGTPFQRINESLGGIIGEVLHSDDKDREHVNLTDRNTAVIIILGALVLAGLIFTICGLLVKSQAILKSGSARSHESGVMLRSTSI